jgi:CysZ protein
MKRLARGFSFAWRGIAHLAGQSSLWKIAALPIALNIVLFVIGIVVYVHFFPDLLAKFMGRPEIWYMWIVYVLVIILLVMAFALFFIVFGFTVVGCARAGPFLDLLSEKVERQLGREEPERSLRQALAGMTRGLIFSLVTLALFVASQLLILALWMLPVVGQIASAVLSPLAEAYFFAAEFFDFPLGRRGLSTCARYRFVNRHRPEAVGFGLAVFLTTLIPLLNFFMLPAAAVGATLLVRALEEDEAHASAAR